MMQFIWGQFGWGLHKVSLQK